MKNKRLYLFIIAITTVIVISLFFFKSTASEEEKIVMSFYPQAKSVDLVKNVTDDLYVSLNFPAVKRAYKVDGEIKAYVVNCIGYNGPIEILAALDTESDMLIGIKILSHEESMDYAGYIEENWFLDRFKNLKTNKYLNLVVLDKENEEDIVQVTGATVSSQAVINGVNAAIGAFQYENNNIEMAKVADVVPQEMWQKDDNSFAINWEDGSVRIDTDEIKEYEQQEIDVTLINTTGTETDMRVKGPTLRDVLAKEGINLSDYAGIGITGRDGYYTMIDKDKLDVNDIILT
ncbi:MAG: FMN-binding protein, partial [Sedimentibacter sp.]